VLLRVEPANLERLEHVGHHHSRVEVPAAGKRVRMRMTIDRHHDEEWTRRTQMGWESQLRKLPAALAVRGR
jgi:hypothetical protein